MTRNSSDPCEQLTARVCGPRPLLDPRSSIARADLVEIGLSSTVAAGRYVAPLPMQVVVPRSAMRKSGAADAVAVSELLFGEGFDLYDSEGCWGFGRSTADHYTGWVLLSAVSEPGLPPSHRIAARRAPVFAGPDIKAAVVAELPFHSRFAATMSGRFAALETGGYVHLAHVEPIDTRAIQPIAAARLFTGAPYVWGGRSPDGVDCSGLVQMALAACGIAAPRDSDQQLAALGTAVPFGERTAGDLIFFPGHVGMLADGDRLFHANAHWMSTVEEPLADVIARLEATGIAAPVTGVRRL